MWGRERGPFSVVGQRRDFRLPTQIRNLSQTKVVISFIAGIRVTFVMQS